MKSPEYDPISSFPVEDARTDNPRGVASGVPHGTPSRQAARTADLFDLIPSVATPEANATRSPGDAADAASLGDDLCKSLRQQYHQALRDPDSMPTAPSRPRSGQAADTPQGSADIDALPTVDTAEALPGDMYRLSDLLGPHADRIPDEFESAGTIPEILGLFAPAGAPGGRRATTLPPLSLREHHSPGIDSPIFELAESHAPDAATRRQRPGRQP
ncbi:TagK domain-containing protein [Paraburkholderia sp. Se-20369]|nr:TagK domain-containing protein [Paraburkholderia sp. Se-20369]